jgi:hypothetical protein
VQAPLARGKFRTKRTHKKIVNHAFRLCLNLTAKVKGISFLAKEGPLSPEEDARLRQVYGYLDRIKRASGHPSQDKDELASGFNVDLGQDEEDALASGLDEDLGQDEDELHLLCEEGC